MAEIKAAQVMELRKKTGVGIMDAKKALVESNGDVAQAIDALREKGMAKAAKKSDRIAAEGLAGIAIDGNTAAIVEVNSETDFVASNDQFKALLKDIAETIAKNKPADMAAAEALPMGEGTIASSVINLTAVIGEKISFRRFELVEKNDGDHFGAYLHNGGQIASLVTLEGADDEAAHDVAMHVSAVNPQYVSREDVHEREVLTEETKNEGKPENIIPKIVEGRVNKFLSEISLNDQAFIKDSDQTVAQFVASKNGSVKGFVRFTVGEGIEKKENNFVDEVMGQIK